MDLECCIITAIIILYDLFHLEIRIGQMDAKVLVKDLFTKLCKLGFSSWSSICESDVINGDPQVYTVFLRYIFLCYPQQTLFFTQKHEWFIINDVSRNFISVVLRLLREEGHFHLGLTAAQFELRKFTSLKAMMCLALIRTLARSNSMNGRKITPPPYRAIAAKERELTSFKEKKEKIMARAHYLNSLPRNE